MAGVEGLDAQKEAESEKTDGDGDEATELLLLEMTGDRTIGDTGSAGVKRVGPGRRTLPLPERGDGLLMSTTRTPGYLCGVAKGALLELLLGLGVVLVLGSFRASAGDVGSLGVVWVGAEGGASSLRESGDGFLSAATARRTLDGSVFLLPNNGVGLLTMSSGLNWKGSDGRDGSDGRVDFEGNELLLLKSGLGDSSVCPPKWNMAGPFISISDLCAGVVGSDLLYCFTTRLGWRRGTGGVSHSVNVSSNKTSRSSSAIFLFIINATAVRSEDGYVGGWAYSSETGV